MAETAACHCDCKDHTRYGDDAGRRNGTTSIYITAVDAIVNVNSLFTIAVFIGLAWSPTDPTTGGIAVGDCVAPNHVAENLVSCHVYAFTGFLSSSLVALCVKQAIRSFGTTPAAIRHPRVNRAFLRGGILVSAVGSMVGCGSLVMALVNMVQIKLGRFGCGGGAAKIGAIIPLVTLVPASMILYAGVIIYAFTR